jgi:hypothetical protein
MFWSSYYDKSWIFFIFVLLSTVIVVVAVDYRFRLIFFLFLFTIIVETKRKNYKKMPRTLMLVGYADGLGQNNGLPGKRD